MIVAMLLSLAVVGQDAAQAKCPAVSSSGGAGEVAGTASFSANVSGGDENVTPTYNWSISAGGIESGQGTPSITVSEVPKGQTVTATVDVGGFDPSCSTTSSTTVEIQ